MVLKWKKIIFLSVLIFISHTIFAQSSGSFGYTDAKSAGLALTYASNALGVDAIGINPANLALNDISKFSMKTLFPLPPISLSLTTPLSVEKYNYFFGGVDDGTGKTVGRYLTQSDKDELNQLLGEKRFSLLIHKSIIYLLQLM